MAGHTVGKVQRNSNVRSLKGSWHISCGLIGSTAWSIATGAGARETGVPGLGGRAVDRGVSADGGARGQKGSIWGVL